MTDEEILKEWVSQFKYRSDADNYGYQEVWTVIKEEPWIGDCEDFSLTLLYRLCNNSILKMLFMILTFQASILYCKIGEEGHAVLWYKGKFADNIQRRWVKYSDLKEQGYNFKTIWTLLFLIPTNQFLKLAIGSTLLAIGGKK